MLTCKKRCYHGADIQTKNYKWEFPVEAENFYMTVNGHTCHHQHTTEKTQRKKTSCNADEIFQGAGNIWQLFMVPKKVEKKIPKICHNLKKNASEAS